MLDNKSLKILNETLELMSQIDKYEGGLINLELFSDGSGCIVSSEDIFFKIDTTFDPVDQWESGTSPLDVLNRLIVKFWQLNNYTLHSY